MPVRPWKLIQVFAVGEASILDPICLGMGKHFHANQTVGGLQRGVWAGPYLLLKKAELEGSGTPACLLLILFKICRE